MGVCALVQAGDGDAGGFGVAVQVVQGGEAGRAGGGGGVVRRGQGSGGPVVGGGRGRGGAGWRVWFRWPGRRCGVGARASCSSRRCARVIFRPRGYSRLSSGAVTASPVAVVVAAMVWTMTS